MPVALNTRKNAIYEILAFRYGFRVLGNRGVRLFVGVALVLFLNKTSAEEIKHQSNKEIHVCIYVYVQKLNVCGYNNCDELLPTSGENLTWFIL